MRPLEKRQRNGFFIKFQTISLAFLLGLMAIGADFAPALADENKGASRIQLDGGTRDPVDFPHHRHQERTGDCTVCHDLFPRQPGVIEMLKAQNKLGRKEVMNKLCIKCHRDRKAAGKPDYGPITCSQCHQK